MKALTISQPFASLIASGEKWIENRRWSTNYRGELAIHSGKGMQYLDKDELKKYPTSCVVAIANLVACVNLHGIIDREPQGTIAGSRYRVGDVLKHQYTEGPFCWILEDVRAIKPVSMSGAQGLWNVDHKLIS